MCRGEKATIVGDHRADAKIQGTAGRDVIVSNGARYINSRRGNDLICVTNLRDFPRGGAVAVVAAGGNDRVHVVGRSRRQVSVGLGSGDDHFIGGPENDRVLTGGPNGGISDAGHDVVSTGAGNDVVVSSGSALRPDRIDLGEGNDAIEALSFASNRLQVLGGSGRDKVTPNDGGPDEDLVIDNAAGQMSHNGVAWIDLSGFEDFDFYTNESIDFTGNASDERVYDGGREGSRAIDTGGGNDTVITSAASESRTVDGGPGIDHLVYASSDEIVVDLELGTAISGNSLTSLSGFEDVYISGFVGPVTLRGTTADESLSAYACHTTIEGRGGNDRLVSASGFDNNEDDPCQHDEPTSIEGPTVMDGGDGDDVLIGSPFDDQLDGGSGTDRLDGREGTDHCLGETLSGCEN